MSACALHDLDRDDRKHDAHHLESTEGGPQGPNALKYTKQIPPKHS